MGSEEGCKERIAELLEADRGPGPPERQDRAVDEVIESGSLVMHDPQAVLCGFDAADDTPRAIEGSLVLLRLDAPPSNLATCPQRGRQPSGGSTRLQGWYDGDHAMRGSGLGSQYSVLNV